MDSCEEIGMPDSSPKTHGSIRKDVSCQGPGDSLLWLVYRFMCGAKWDRDRTQAPKSCLLCCEVCS